MEVEVDGGTFLLKTDCCRVLAKLAVGVTFKWLGDNISEAKRNNAPAVID